MCTVSTYPTGQNPLPIFCLFLQIPFSPHCTSNWHLFPKKHSPRYSCSLEKKFKHFILYKYFVSPNKLGFCKRQNDCKFFLSKLGLYLGVHIGLDRVGVGVGRWFFLPTILKHFGFQSKREIGPAELVSAS